MIDLENCFNVGMLMARNDEEYRRAARDLYDVQMMRPPMMEADIDWRAPQEYRAMVKGDL